MKLKFLKHKWQKWLFWSFSIFIALILLFSLYINLYWSPILAGKLKSAVLSGSDSLYNIDFTDAKLHIIKGEIDVYNITLKPDTAVYNRRKKAHLAPNNLVVLHVKRVVLSHIHPFLLYFKHRLNFGEIILSEPELNVSYQLNHTKDTVARDNRTAWQKISKSLKSVHVGQILLNNVKFKYEDYSGNKVATSELKEMNLSATDLLIDSATQTDRTRLLYCKDILAELNNYSGKTASGLYTYKIKSLRLSTQISRLTIQGLELQPAKPNVFFNKSTHDRFNIHLDSLELRNFDYLSYHKYRIVNASRMIMSRGGINIFARPQPPGTPPGKIDKVKSFPNFALQKLKADIKVDTIDIEHANVSYTEFNEKTNKSGTIIFSNTRAHLLNVTTNKDALQKNNICTAKVSTRFMDKGMLNVFFSFNLTDPKVPFSYKGTLGPLNLQLINPVIMPLALVKITSGKLTGMNFNIHANSTVSKGKVEVLYTDLKVNLLKADTANNKFKHLTIASLLANALVIKRNNPDNDGETARSVNVVYVRPKSSAFFQNMWQTLLAGIKPCAGLSEQMQQTVQTKIAEEPTRQQERMTKKAMRQQRRAERRRKRALKKAMKEKK